MNRMKAGILLPGSCPFCTKRHCIEAFSGDFGCRMRLPKGRHYRVDIGAPANAVHPRGRSVVFTRFRGESVYFRDKLQLVKAARIIGLMTKISGVRGEPY